MARFFIDRPIFAWVIAIIIMLAGGAVDHAAAGLRSIPTIAPPTVTINATYPGASAKTVEDSVTQVIEQHMTGSTACSTCRRPASSNGARAASPLTFDERHRPRHRAGAGAEQAAAGDAAAAAGRAAAGRQRQQGQPGFLMVARLRLRETAA